MLKLVNNIIFKYDITLKKFIVQKSKEGLSQRQISRMCKIPRPSVQYIIKNSAKQLKKRGPKNKISKIDKRHIRFMLDESQKNQNRFTLNDLRQSLSLNASITTTWRAVKSIEYSYKNIPWKIKLSHQSRVVRVEAAKQFIISGMNWFNIAFSDEKLFTLGGVDSYYCWIKDGSEPSRIRKVLRQPGVMVWAMILPNGLLSYRIMEGKQNSLKYIRIIRESAIPIINLNYESRLTFQHDNAPIHVSRETKLFLKSQQIDVLQWPPYSPDLNIIENIWSVLSNSIYKEGAIKNIAQLKFKIQEAIHDFNETKMNLVQNLYKSMPSRLVSVIAKRGDRLKY